MKAHKSIYRYTLLGFMGLVLSWPVSAGNVKGRTVTGILTYDTYAVVFYKPANGGKLGCTGKFAKSRAVIDWKNDNNNKVLYSAALSAYLLGKAVGFGTKGCHKYAKSTPKVYRIKVSD